MGLKKTFLIIVFVAVLALCLQYIYSKNSFIFKRTVWSEKILYDVSGSLSTTFTTSNENLSAWKRTDIDVEDFFLTDLVEHPEEANKLSVLLQSTHEVIKEAQRIHANIFQSLLGKYKYAVLFDYTPSENKGDAAIAVGELILLKKLKIEIIFACPAFKCTREKLREAKEISKNFKNDDLVILFHGGGNVIGWPVADKWRAAEISLFMDYQIVMFPQSILYIEPQSHIDFCKKLYASHKNLTFIWRDKVSYNLGKRLFPNVKSLMSPDMAYQIGPVPRFMLPTQDILWIKRSDKESPIVKSPTIHTRFRVVISDWLGWKTPKGTSQMEDVFLMTTNGLTFLQRGRIVITDRLHGHILSTLLNIPHVYIDNQQRKISNYRNTWTASVENIVLADSSNKAIIHAEQLLTRLPNLTVSDCKHRSYQKSLFP